MFLTPLKTALSVQYILQNKETDISLEIAQDLLQCTYTDGIEDDADTVSLMLKDPLGKWAGSWSPARGDKVQVAFITEARGALSTQKMTIDRLSTQGRPRVFTVDAVSVPLGGTIRRTCKTRTFEKMTLKDIGQRIADDNELWFMWDCEENPEYDRTDQQDVSDLKFLSNLAKDAGFSVKVTAETVIIFDQASYEKKTAVKTIQESGGTLLSWSFTAQQSERYKACTVKWRDIKKRTKTPAASTKKKDDRQAILDSYINGYQPSKGAKTKKGSTAVKAEVMEYTYSDPDVDDSGQVYKMKKRCTSQADAERIARAKLRELNLRQLTGSLTLIGDPLLCAGSVVTLSGFGSFDGNFIIEKAVHTMSQDGYRTSVDVRRVNNNY